MIEQNKEAFSIMVVGDVTGETLKGTFAAKKWLSHRDRLNQDKIRRELLGSLNPDGASITALSIAEAVSEITVRLIDSPKWWAETQNGLDLQDSNVVSEVYKGVMKVESDALTALEKKGEEAKKALQALPEEK